MTTIRAVSFPSSCSFEMPVRNLPMPAALSAASSRSHLTRTACREWITKRGEGTGIALTGKRGAVVSRASSASKVPNADLLVVAERAAKAGADIVLDRVDKPRSISFKGATDLVTDTDQASEDAILSVIQDAFPGHAVLGEEGGVFGDTSSDYLWCVDPLDGTTNFAHGYPSFSVCVACLRHALPVAATVVEFAGGPGTWVTRTYTAARNKGAFMNGKPISVSRVHEIERSLLITGFGYEHDEAWLANIGLFQHFTDVTQGVRRLGSAAIDMCHVASGTCSSESGRCLFLLCKLSLYQNWFKFYYCVALVIVQDIVAYRYC